jgi:hypothetical protein
MFGIAHSKLKQRLNLGDCLFFLDQALELVKVCVWQQRSNLRMQYNEVRRLQNSSSQFELCIIHLFLFLDIEIRHKVGSRESRLLRRRLVLRNLSLEKFFVLHGIFG